MTSTEFAVIRPPPQRCHALCCTPTPSFLFLSGPRNWLFLHDARATAYRLWPRLEVRQPPASGHYTVTPLNNRLAPRHCKKKKKRSRRFLMRQYSRHVRLSSRLRGATRQVIKWEQEKRNGHRDDKPRRRMNASRQCETNSQPCGRLAECCSAPQFRHVFEDADLRRPSVHKEPLATYQCFRNGTSFEDPSATGLSVLWNGRGLPENKADTVVSFSLPGKERKTSFHVSAEYVPQKDHGILAAEGKNVELYLLLPPHDGKAYFFKQVDTSNGAVSFKIYDTSTSCENAQALRKAICPEPCSLESAQ
ncbi:hypothetical protein V5799_020709 [Amblyomma americanum]|uniref:Uncharacterized protein n=1 Tax=Amblyomma americanum TaxID=6943 RepID=A0AAQ4ETA9_AMBAM